MVCLESIVLIGYSYSVIRMDFFVIKERKAEYNTRLLALMGMVLGRHTGKEGLTDPKIVDAVSVGVASVAECACEFDVAIGR